MPLPGVPHVFKDRFWQCGCKVRECEHYQDYVAWDEKNKAEQRLICRSDCPYCWSDQTTKE